MKGKKKPHLELHLCPGKWLLTNVVTRVNLDIELINFKELGKLC